MKTRKVFVKTKEGCRLCCLARFKIVEYPDFRFDDDHFYHYCSTAAYLYHMLQELLKIIKGLFMMYPQLHNYLHNYTVVGQFAYFLRNMTGYSKYLSVKEAATAEKDQEQKEKSLNLYLIIT